MTAHGWARTRRDSRAGWNLPDVRRVLTGEREVRTVKEMARVTKWLFNPPVDAPTVGRPCRSYEFMITDPLSSRRPSTALRWPATETARTSRTGN
jgi:hypothetical protein